MVSGAVGMAVNGPRDGLGSQRQESGSPRVAIVCAECGRNAEVPFVPREDRKVYCSDCFAKVRAQRLQIAS
jgi:CxxC-x17-CxxC domain-containing protein